MLTSSLLPLVLAIAGISNVLADSIYTPVCQALSSAISAASDISYPLTTAYEKGIYHWASSSTQNAACVAEPGNVEDISSILKLLASTKTPFAVKGGGHTSNPGFSSTLGVHISLSRFSEVTYNETSETVTIGSGLVWDDVYAALDPLGVSVAGGRVSGVGVAGFILGGGYSWKTNQYGLSIDTIQSFELVLPTGSIIEVSTDSYPDLFFGLKGGGNNFGIVTKFVLKAYKQTDIWGGPIYYTADQYDSFSAAIAAFATNVTDPKASILPTYDAFFGVPGATSLMFYDGPTPPAGIFDDFLAIPHVGADVKTRSFTSMLADAPANVTANVRTFFQTVPVKVWTPNILAAIVNETNFWAPRLALNSGTFISYDVEPFLATHLTHSTSPSAFPPDSARDPSVVTYPLNIYYAWTSELADGSFYDAIYASANQIKSLVAAEQGEAVSSAPMYNNYAMYDTPLESLYGENVPSLKALAQKYDPYSVLHLAGGFKL